MITVSDPAFRHPGVQWDEMNILMTNHPPNKDYGHMKIEEPKTPYNYDASGSEGEAISDDDEGKRNRLDPRALADRIQGVNSAAEWRNDEQAEASDEETKHMTAEEIAQRKAFNEKRKHHYNEFLMIQKARQLIAQDEDDENEAQMDIQDVQEHQNMGSQRVVDSELGE
jgi:protein phosphatase inhibitor 2